MGKPKRLIQILWESVFMDKSKDVCTYYTLHVWEDNYGNTIIFKFTSSLIFILRVLKIWLRNSRNNGVCLKLIASSSAFLLRKKYLNKTTYILFITHQTVKTWWFMCTPNRHENDKNSTSPYKWKIISWYQVRFVEN